MKEIPGCKQKRNNIPGQNIGGCGTQWNKTDHQTERYETSARSILAKIATNHHQQDLTGYRNRPIRNEPHKKQSLFENNHTINNTQVKMQIKP